MTEPPILLGTYKPPAVRVGGRYYCRFRKLRCRVTGYSDAPIPWPRALASGSSGPSAPLVTRTLERAIRTESAAALKHFFGVKDGLVWRWRKWLGVEGHTKTVGSRLLQQEVSEKGAAGIRAKEWTDEELDRKSRIAKRAGIRPGDRWKDRHWTPGEHALLGTAGDRAIAARIGRSVAEVTSRRVHAGIPAFPGGVNYWTAEELALLGTDHDEMIAAKVGRTVKAVEWKRGVLKIPPFVDRRKRHRGDSVRRETDVAQQSPRPAPSRPGPLTRRTSGGTSG